MEAARREWWEIGCFVILAYTFGLRVPSELVGQSRRDLFQFTSGSISYGPIRRKGQLHPQVLSRPCVCTSNPILCVHHWLAVQCSARPEGLLFQRTTNTLMGKFILILVALRVPQAEFFTSHCFRRGAGVDILEAHGLKAMLEFGQWKTPAAAEAYASADEQAAHAMGTALAEFSEEEV